MTELDILKYLQEKDTSEYYVDILDFVKQNLNDSALSYDHLRHLLEVLLTKGYVYRHKDCVAYKNLGTSVMAIDAKPDARFVYMSFVELSKRAKTNPYDGIGLKLTLDGRKEIAEVLFKEQLSAVNQSVINSNNKTDLFYKSQRRLTRVLAFASAIYTIVAVAQFFKSCSEKTEQPQRYSLPQLQQKSQSLATTGIYPKGLHP